MPTKIYCDGTTLSIGGAITGVISFNVGEETMNTPDITDLLSSDNTRDFGGGLIDPGELSGECFCTTGSAGLISSMQTAFSSGTKASVTCTVTYPDGRTRSGQGHVSKWAETVQLGEYIKASFAVKKTGKWTYS